MQDSVRSYFLKNGLGVVVSSDLEPLVVFYPILIRTTGLHFYAVSEFFFHFTFEKYENFQIINGLIKTTRL